jgi:hypothetical protein
MERSKRQGAGGMVVGVVAFCELARSNFLTLRDARHGDTPQKVVSDDRRYTGVAVALLTFTLREEGRGVWRQGEQCHLGSSGLLTS